jgi:hypothetical protein
MTSVADDEVCSFPQQTEHSKCGFLLLLVDFKMEAENSTEISVDATSQTTGQPREPQFRILLILSLFLFYTG